MCNIKGLNFEVLRNEKLGVMEECGISDCFFLQLEQQTPPLLSGPFQPLLLCFYSLSSHFPPHILLLDTWTEILHERSVFIFPVSCSFCLLFTAGVMRSLAKPEI